MEKLELYIHIPFCVKKCDYCDFLSFQSNFEKRKKYISALIKEIKNHNIEVERYKVATVFVGGGTPSLLEKELMIELVSCINEKFEFLEKIEFSIEVNPGTVDEEKLETYKNLGINRLSIGLQSTDDQELIQLGRIHTYKEFLETYETARRVGIENINVDLMSGIPGQTLKTWEESLRRVTRLEPEHISAYSLIVEEGTTFYEKYSEKDYLLPNETTEREMYYMTCNLLKESGYFQYEVSNYSKKDFECKHNLGYWDRVDYVGFGLGAASLLDNVRYKNEENLEEYIKKCDQNLNLWTEKEVIDRNGQIEEFMFLGLRKNEGISKKKFLEEFGESVFHIYEGQLKELSDKALLEEVGDFIRLTKKGEDLSNYVLAEFLM